MKANFAELIGTFVLVFFGVGSAVLAGSGIGIADAISITGISFAFGISVGTILPLRDLVRRAGARAMAASFS